LNRLHETGCVRVVAERLANLSHCGVDTVLRVDKDIFSPETLLNFLAAYQAAIGFSQQLQQLHGNFFQLNGMTGAAQLIAGAVKLKVGEF
jgi:hypothetical protein